MRDLAILFIYTNKCKLTNINYNSIVRHSDGAPVYAIHQNDFSNYFYDFLDYRHISQWSGRDIWYWGSDNIFLYWYLSNPDKRAKQYLILEYDAYAASNIRNSLNIDDETIENNGILSANTIHAKNHGGGYWWFDAQRFHPLIDRFYGWNKFSACSPLCANLISDTAVEAILSHIKQHNLSNKLYVETKFATILNYLDFRVDNFNHAKETRLDQNISYCKHICLRKIEEEISKNIQLKGIYHPIKDIDIIERYFMQHKINRSTIHKALFGNINDALSGINFLKDYVGMNSITIDNALCGDPAPGFPKKLYLKYKKNEEICTKIINEGDVLIFDDL